MRSLAFWPECIVVIECAEWIPPEPGLARRPNAEDSFRHDAERLKREGGNVQSEAEIAQRCA